MAAASTPGGVLVIYSGGTVGAVRPRGDDADAPLVPGSVERLREHLPLVEGRFLRFGRTLVPVDVVATPELLDSTNVRPSDWVVLARLVETHYGSYDGFVVLHGTDTMAFTASALSFMFENLAKPVVLTGSQRPIGETRSDALQNVVTAVEIAGARCLGGAVVPEVCVFFRDELLRGCRVTKTSASAYDGFHSPNCPPLGRAGEHIRVDETVVRPPGTGPFAVRTALDRNLAVLQVSPLMSAPMLDRILSAEDLHAVILRSYGVGNVPSDPAFLDVVERAVRRGVKVVAVTQCLQGAVELGVYETSMGLLERGVLSGVDLTPEAAQTKMAVLLEDEGLVDSVEALMQVSLRGEQSGSLFTLDFGAGSASPRALCRQAAPFPAPSHFRRDRLASAKLRMLGLELEGAAADPLVRVGLGEGKAAPASDAWVPCRLSMGPGGELRCFADLTAQASLMLDPGRKATLAVEVEGAAALRWRRMSLALFLDE